MPLTKGFRDEDNERYKNSLQRLIGMDFVPDNFFAAEKELGALGISLPELETINESDLTAKIRELKLNDENAEIFADFLVKSGFANKAKSLYNYIQQNSGTFSLGIFNKINAIK